MLFVAPEATGTQNITKVVCLSCSIYVFVLLFVRKKSVARGASFSSLQTSTTTCPLIPYYAYLYENGSADGYESQEYDQEELLTMLKLGPLALRSSRLAAVRLCGCAA